MEQFPLSSESQDFHFVNTAYIQCYNILMYIKMGTRADLAFSVGKMSQFIDCHTEARWVMVNLGFRHVCGTKHYGITFSTSQGFFTSPIGYSGAELNRYSINRKLTSGFVLSVSGRAISWPSSKQKLTAGSTAEADYVSLAGATQEAV